MSALNYTGSTSKVTCPSLPSMGTPTQVTCITWCYPTSIAGSGRISQKGLAAGIQWFHTFAGAGTTIDVEIGRATTFSQATAAMTNFAFWGLSKLICIVAQGDVGTAGNNKILIGDVNNRVAEPSSYSTQIAGSGTQTAWDSTAYIIGNKSNDNAPFQGSILSQAIWPRLLSLTEIYAQQEQLTPTYDCAGAWLLGTNGAGAVLDLTGRNNHGAITACVPINLNRPRGFLRRRAA